MHYIQQDIEKVLFTEEQLRTRVRELGKMIEKDYEGQKLIIVGILKGAGIFMSDLIRTIEMPIRTDYMVVSSYGNTTISSGIVRIIKDLETDIAGWNILIVEDIVDTGRTLSYLKEYLLNRGASSVKICTLLDKPDRRVKPVDIDYCGFIAPDEFIVGYGIDYAERYRNMPFIGVLKRSVYE